jgi:hypothetical protein
MTHSNLRTVDQILAEQNIALPALVKAARLNMEYHNSDFSYGARSVAKTLTNDHEEVTLIRDAIIRQWRTFGETDPR